MNKIETLIKVNIDKHPNFEEYFKIIDVIKENENVNPDICIESCKALIEGVSKTIYNKIDASKGIAELDKYTSVEKLFKDAMSKLAEKCDDNFEGDFVRQYSTMIHVIGEIRNKRGDISHGRVAPKPVYSSVKFASTVVKMSSSILEYILEHYFRLEINPVIKLDFDAEEMEAYNSWLDDSVAFPIAKARYCKVLYENDYDEYESGYIDYLKSIEKEDAETEEFVEKAPQVSPIKDTPPIAPFAGEPIESANTEILINDITEDENKGPSIFHSSSSTPFDSDDHFKKMYELLMGKHTEEKKEVVQLVNNFDEASYWTKERIENLNAFAEIEEIISDKLNPIIDEYLFTGKRPLRDAVVECLNEKPALKDRAKVVDALTDKIIAFANELNTLTE